MKILYVLQKRGVLFQGSYTHKPCPNFCRRLPPVNQIDNFLPNEFATHGLADNFILVVVVEYSKKWDVA